MQSVESREDLHSSIDIKTKGTLTEVHLDGLDISNRVTKIAFEHDPEKGLPLVTLTLFSDTIRIRTVGDVLAQKYELRVRDEFRTEH